LANDLGDNFGVGVGGLLRGAVPGNVGLENDNVLATDKAADATQVFESALDKSAGFAALDDCDVGELGIGGHAMVAAALFGKGRNGPEAALIEPYGRACRARCYASRAQQLQHGLAARER
jgi:hypothetical protein